MFFGESFTSKNIYHYLFAVGLIMVASFVGNKFKANFVEQNDEYEMIRKYLLNESPLEGFSKPKLWIHTKFEYNARQWESFGSRSSTNLNQPYLHATIRSIIQQCGDDFHICLIDDDSFSKLIPSWDIHLNSVADPMKSHIRAIGLTQLIYYYGGILVPNSFLCTRELLSLYEDATEKGSKAFAVEAPNRRCNMMSANTDNGRLAFLPSLSFMGAHKNNETMKLLAEYMKSRISNSHFSSDKEFLGDTEYWCLSHVDSGNMNMVPGEMVGVKTVKKKKAISIDNWMENEYLDLSPQRYGLWIPADDILQRTKYQWLAVMPVEQFLTENDSILSKQMRAAMINGAKEHLPKTAKQSMAI
jgi:hypothetical protein